MVLPRIRPALAPVVRDLAHLQRLEQLADRKHGAAAGGGLAAQRSMQVHGLHAQQGVTG